MSLDNKPVYSGGCQCGAVRFRIEGALGDGIGLPLPHVPEGMRQFLCRAGLGARRQAGLDARRSRSGSARPSHAWRGFCEACGTPLTFEAPEGWRWRSAPSTTPRSSRRRSSGASRPSCPMSIRVAALPGEETLPTRRQPPIWPTSSPTSIRTTTPKHGRRRAIAHDERVHRRLPVRRGALPRPARSGAPSICHCRMCQKAFGSFFGPLCDGARTSNWTRGAPKYFHSSNAGPARLLRRLRHAADLRGGAGGARARHRRLRRSGARRAAGDPGESATTSSPSSTALRRLPPRPAAEQPQADDFSSPRVVSHQHPDHDTDALAAAGRTLMSEALRTLLSARSSPTSPACSTSATATDLLGTRRHAAARKPAVFLHGGPGGGIIRAATGGCSIPRATTCCCSTSAAAASRRRMPSSRPTPPGISSPISSGCARWSGVERWLVFGGSWGSTLALAYAETHPERVSELVLRGIFTLRRCGARLVLPARRLAALPRQMGALPRADPGSRARRPDRRLPQAPDQRRSRGRASRRRGPGAAGKARRSRCCPIRRPATRSTTTISRSPSRASRTTISSMPAGWRRAS